VERQENRNITAGDDDAGDDRTAGARGACLSVRRCRCRLDGVLRRVVGNEVLMHQRLPCHRRGAICSVTNVVGKKPWGREQISERCC